MNSRQPSPILSTVAQTSLFVIKLVAVWIFFRGHQEPGGGFIAGVIMAAAVGLQGLAFGHEAADGILPVPFWILLGVGLAISASTVVVPTILGYSFMKHAFGHVTLPWFGEVEWATAALFDLGVFLVVVGSAKAILLHIAEGKADEPAAPGESEQRGLRRRRKRGGAR